jgi:uncharacterized protein (TIGR00375 family)
MEITLKRIHMMIINADLHIHSPFTKKSKGKIDFELLAKNAEKKGLHILSTGDCLHPGWLKNIIQLEPIDLGTFQCYNTNFVLSTEIQSNDNVHHLLYFPDLTSLYDFREHITCCSTDLKLNGRPYVDVSSEKLANIAIDTSALIGPSHIFDLFSGLYSHYNTLADCYGSAVSEIYFAELGLGIDSYHADFLKELHPLTFITNSDTHNPHPIRLGREFTQFQVKKPTCKYLFQAIKRKQHHRPVLNAGIPPEEGKYYQTGCIKCQKSYSIKEAKKRKWKCRCGGVIKKGMKEKILEKSTSKQLHYPYHRPRYLSILPLHEIITRVLQEKNPFTENVESCWNALVSTFGNEIHVMLETPINDIEKVTNQSIAEAIKVFRLATFSYKEGRGGSYGTLYL